MTTAPHTLGAHSEIDSRLGERTPDASSIALLWTGWRLRVLVLALLLGCAGLFLFARWLAEAPFLSASWSENSAGQVELTSSDLPALTRQVGEVLVGLVGTSADMAVVSPLALRPSARWVIDDALRERHRGTQEQLADAMAQSPVTLVFSDGEHIPLQLPRRGFAALGATFWMLTGLAMALYLTAVVVPLAHRSERNLLYALMSLCQVGNLVFVAVESTLALALPRPFPAWNFPVRASFDLITAAAVVHAASLYMKRYPGAPMIAHGGWAVTAVLITLISFGWMSHDWWWVQGSMIALGVLAIWLLNWSYRTEPHPFVIVLRRFGIMAVGTWAALTAALAVSGEPKGFQADMVTGSATACYAFLAALLLMVPFLSRSQQLMREYSMLAVVGTVAILLDFLFVAELRLGQFTSLVLSLGLSLGLYAAARQWILNQLLGSKTLTTEAVFERIYRMAREVETHPGRVSSLLAQLLQDMFDPLRVSVIELQSSRAKLADDDSTLLVPVPCLAGDVDLQGEARPSTVVIRFADRGRRLFTKEDAHLTDRVVEQLRRAVAFDKAVEQGRSEERLRLAQDLHDDIGARLLTLIYKAPSPEMEDYLRYTLQDLKTLTRGLSASSHRLSHTLTEWKADLAHRLAAADIELVWNVSQDREVILNVVQWSALTRILRELVSNTIAHANANRVDVEIHLEGEGMELCVTDNGSGRAPQGWAHGLGLGGVRKRVKQLGGKVQWCEVTPSGISCRVSVRSLSRAPR